MTPGGRSLSVPAMGRPLRIAIDLRPATLASVSGVGLVTMGVIEALAEQGHVFVGITDRPVPPGRVAPTLPVLAEGAPGGRVRWEAFVLPRLLRRLDPAPDLYHATWNHGVPGALPFPSVLTIHDLIPWRMPDAVPWPKPAILHRALYRGSMRRSARRAKSIVAVSEATRREIEALLPDEAPRVTVVPNALPRWFRAAGPSSAAEARLRFADGRPYWLYLGGFDPRKGLDVLIRAMAEAFPDRERAPELVLAGAMNDSGRSAHALAADLRVRARFPGYVPDADLAFLLAGATLFVYPSRVEGFGIPLLLAMASGIPCVAADAGAIPEVVGDAGMLFPPGDVSALASLLGDAARSPERLDAIRGRGPARARGFTAEAQAERMIRVYEAAAATRSGSA